ncbi:matrix-remodeling-associated protein 7 isoform X2 [Amia ocellicauda]|uniref:matrix-remodeling-associated protein 7 isoform X2 n=1 Tax=Amia ocellicauda TaxID=2972642 RepID=UPI0034645E26
MDVDLGIDMYLAVPAIFFTLLAVIVASALVKMWSAAPAADRGMTTPGDAAAAQATEGEKSGDPGESTRGEEEPVELSQETDTKAEEFKMKQEQGKEQVEAAAAPVVEEIGAADGETVEEDEEPSPPEREDNPEITDRQGFPTEAEKTVPHKTEQEFDYDAVTADVEEMDMSLKYSPGKLRASQYETMMTKEELEEEQRIEFTTDFTSL